MTGSQVPQGGSFISKVSRSATLKLFFLSFLTLCFLMPLAMVKGVIMERIGYKNEAAQDIAESWAGEQTIYGPLLIIPYTKTAQQEYFDHKTQTTKVKTVTSQHYKYHLPDKVHATADVSTQERYRGIYSVPVYQADLKLQGAFVGLNDVLDELTLRGHTIGKPYVSIGLSDVRGIFEEIDIRLGGKALAVQPGSKIKNDSYGIHAPLDATYEPSSDEIFSIEMKVKGIKNFSFIPVGKETKLSMTSPWPDPSFGGRFLPAEREITESGFTAHWASSELATNISHDLEQCLYKNSCYAFKAQNYSVSFYQSGDVYQQAIRAVKYGVLFLSLTFFAFFIYEAMKKMRIHPVQYILVGSVLAIFFLLLVSLSEHMSFIASYIIAALSVVILLGYYIAHMMKRAVMGAFFGGLIAGLYTVLYFILQSQDYALLTGTVFLFAVLAGVMIVTRKMNWYDVSGNRAG